MFAPLTDLGLLRADGDDAATFLHSQLTNDISHLGTSEARLAGYCSAKGRLMASFLVWKTDASIWLQLPQPIQAPVQKRLQMFVLRAKVKLTDATDEHAILGLAGNGVLDFLRSRFAQLPALPYGVTASEHGVAIRLPSAAGVPRFQWVTSPEKAVNAWPELTRLLTRADPSVCRHMDIEAGIPQIVSETQEQFVPQMVNYELIGGVNFKKGCYPGQEIVARSQYLGKLKRRMQLASVEAINIVPGTEVFSSSDATQPSGMVVNAEATGPNSSDCLVELKLAALENGTLHLHSPAGPVLHFRDLPYPLVDPV